LYDDWLSWVWEKHSKGVSGRNFEKDWARTGYQGSRQHHEHLHFSINTIPIFTPATLAYVDVDGVYPSVEATERSACVYILDLPLGSGAGRSGLGLVLRLYPPFAKPPKPLTLSNQRIRINRLGGLPSPMFHWEWNPPTIPACPLCLLQAGTGTQCKHAWPIRFGDRKVDFRYTSNASLDQNATHRMSESR